MMANPKTLLFFSFLFISFLASAQEFRWMSRIGPVSENGFYTIPLSMDWMLYNQADLSDTRIQDESKKPVPYLVKRSWVNHSSNFIEFPISTRIDSTITTVEISAAARPGINELFLIMGNTGVERTASLSGSNDGRQWYIVEENILLQKGIRENEIYIQKIIFPFIRYSRLKLKINNKGTDPLAVLKAGVYMESPVKDQSLVVIHEGTTFRQKDSSDGNSYIRVMNERPYPVDKIDLILNGPRYYKRTASIFEPLLHGGNKLLGEAELNSDLEHSIRVHAGKTKELLIRIRNGDNPPLQITAVRTAGIRPEIIAYLEKGKDYTLMGGDSTLLHPSYELAHFKDSIPSFASMVEIGPVIPIENIQVKTENKRSWLWPAIILMMAVLSYLTFRLTREIRKSTSGSA